MKPTSMTLLAIAAGLAVPAFVTNAGNGQPVSNTQIATIVAVWDSGDGVSEVLLQTKSGGYQVKKTTNQTIQMGDRIFISIPGGDV